jgi:hypothetical protein
MTPEQLAKSRLYGCVPSCLIQLAAIRGTHITQDDFCTRYESFFINPAECYRWLSYDAVLPVLKDLGLATVVNETIDCEVVRHAFNIETRMVLVRSLVNLNPGATDDLDHCSVLHAIGENAFELWTASQNGWAGVLPTFARADWGIKKCSAKIFS